MKEPFDNYTKLLADLDQAKAALPQLAGMVFSYFKSMTDAGFERAEALALTRDFLQSLGK